MLILFTDISPLASVRHEFLNLPGGVPGRAQVASKTLILIYTVVYKFLHR